MKLTWIDVYLDTLIGGENVDSIYDGDNSICVGVWDDALNNWITSETDFKDRRDFDENYTCDDTDEFIKEMQVNGGTIFIEDRDVYVLADLWEDNGNLKLIFHSGDDDPACYAEMERVSKECFRYFPEPKVMDLMNFF